MAVESKTRYRKKDDIDREMVEIGVVIFGDDNDEEDENKMRGRDKGCTSSGVSTPFPDLFVEVYEGVPELLPERARPSESHRLRRHGPRLCLLLQIYETRLFAAKEGGDGHAIANHEAVDGGCNGDEQREEEMDGDHLE
ncbi:hypothetical protein Ddye_024280 [Dipteronia dyeriana]|uniref:Uncharacterized protein n=1 Tax=Dipteronia dyeriana TaxID=168575 RepID=A0AAD9TUM5_9ROSI|nr:hypothetical protein Ddye_024280 [Dipteronia dyeriana]